VSESDQKVHILGDGVRQVTLGEDIELRCTSSGPIGREIVWSKVNDAMPPSSRLIVDGAKIVIRNVEVCYKYSTGRLHVPVLILQESDLGEYECKAISTSDSRMELDKQTVRLYRGPLSAAQIYIDGGQEVRVVDAGASLALRCAATGMCVVYVRTRVLVCSGCCEVVIECINIW
jgi:hypothetical protein